MQAGGHGGQVKARRHSMGSRMTKEPLSLPAQPPSPASQHAQPTMKVKSVRAGEYTAPPAQGPITSDS